MPDQHVNNHEPETLTAARHRRTQWARKPFAAAVLVLAACTGGGGGQDTSSSGASLSGAGAFDPDREGPAAPIEGAVDGGTVTVLGATDSTFPAKDELAKLATTDPTGAYNLIPKSILSGLVTRSLTQYVYDPEQGTMVLVPDLATDLGTPNPDFTQWSFTIRDGVRFEDGTEVTAEDVAYGIKRSFDRPTFKQGPAYSNDYFLDDDNYRGLYTSGTSYAGVVVDGDTLTLKMERPFLDMPHWGAFPAMGPIPERGSDPATYGLHPLATGPYKFADYTPGESLTLVRNEEWDPATDPGRHAYPDRWEFDFTETAARIDSTILGDSEQGQTTLTMDDVLPGYYPRAKQLDRLTLGSGPCTGWWSPDYRTITDIRVREAIGYAYPYEKAARRAGNIVGVTSLPGTSILPPGFPGRQEYDVLDTPPGHTDPDKARALLRAASYAPGEYELKFAYAADNPVPVERFVKAFEAGGFQATPRLLPTSKEVSSVISDPNAPINLRQQGWCPDWPSGAEWFSSTFHSDGFGNSANFDEPAIDSEIERISRLPIDEQPAAWGALDKTIMTDYYPVVITDYLGVAMLHGSKIGGMNTDNALGMPTWKDIHVIE